MQHAITYAPPVPDPLSGLNARDGIADEHSQLHRWRCQRGRRLAYATCNSWPNAPLADPCYNSAPRLPDATMSSFGESSTTLNGVYFFGGRPQDNGSAHHNRDSDVDLAAGIDAADQRQSDLISPALHRSTCRRSATVTAAQVPTALQGSSTLALMSKLAHLIIRKYERQSERQYTGNHRATSDGITYAPNANVTYQGSTTSDACTRS